MADVSQSADLYINGNDALTMYRVRMGEGFVSTLKTPPPLKSFITNKSRASHGQTIITSSVKKDSRDITLSFIIDTNSKAELKTYYSAFLAVLEGVAVNIYVPAIGQYTFRLVYRGTNVRYSETYAGTSATISASFTEPDPTNRSMP